jgi:hypothetical protein
MHQPMKVMFLSDDLTKFVTIKILNLSVNITCNFWNVLICGTLFIPFINSPPPRKNIFSQNTTQQSIPHNCVHYKACLVTAHIYIYMTEQRLENSPITISATLTCPPHLRHFTPLHSSGRTAVRFRSLPLPTTSRFMLASFHTS